MARIAPTSALVFPRATHDRTSRLAPAQAQTVQRRRRLRSRLVDEQQAFAPIPIGQQPDDQALAAALDDERPARGAGCARPPELRQPLSRPRAQRVRQPRGRASGPVVLVDQDAGPLGAQADPAAPIHHCHTLIALLERDAQLSAPPLDGIERLRIAQGEGDG